MLRVCSFFPAATSIIYQLGLESYLVGVTFECPSNKPKVVRSYIEENDYTSEELYEIVAEFKKEGRPLYYIDEELFSALSPDIIFTEYTDFSSNKNAAYLNRAITKLEKQPKIIPLAPKNLDDVLGNAKTIATALNHSKASELLLAKIESKIQQILNTLWKNNAPLRKVLVLEWLNPLHNSGNWVPFLVAKAGGIDMLSNPGGNSVILDWEKILQYNPEVIVIAPRGFDLERTSKEINRLAMMSGWNEIRAVKDNAVYVADSDLFNTASTTLAYGVELLAAVFHPELFKVPGYLNHKWINFSKVRTQIEI